jgi:Uma2 family endonuclease
VRTQLPLVFTLYNKPEPDVAVVIGSFRDYSTMNPTTAVLVVEVSDSTLLTDQTTKAAVYARAGIREYWIINIPGRLLEVYREPSAMPGQPLGHHYRSITRYSEDGILSPLAAPEGIVSVADLLP